MGREISRMEKKADARCRSRLSFSFALSITRLVDGKFFTEREFPIGKVRKETKVASESKYSSSPAQSSFTSKILPQRSFFNPILQIY